MAPDIGMRAAAEICAAAAAGGDRAALRHLGREGRRSGAVERLSSLAGRVGLYEWLARERRGCGVSLTDAASQGLSVLGWLSRERRSCGLSLADVTSRGLGVIEWVCSEEWAEIPGEALRGDTAVLHWFGARGMINENISCLIRHSSHRCDLAALNYLARRGQLTAELRWQAADAAAGAGDSKAVLWLRPAPNQWLLRCALLEFRVTLLEWMGEWATAERCSAVLQRVDPVGCADRGKLLASLAWLESRGIPIAARDLPWLAKYAASVGHRGLLQWLAERGLQNYDAPWEAAAWANCVAGLQWLAERGHASRERRSRAWATVNKVPALEWLRSVAEAGEMEAAMRAPAPTDTRSHWLARVAAEDDDVALLDWLERRGCLALGPTFAIAAACQGSLGALEWLAQRRDLSGQFSEIIAAGGAAGSAAAVLEWALARGATFDDLGAAATLLNASRRGDVATLRRCKIVAAAAGRPLSALAARSPRHIESIPSAALDWLADHGLVEPAEPDKASVKLPHGAVVTYAEQRAHMAEWLDERGWLTKDGVEALAVEGVKYSREALLDWLMDSGHVTARYIAQLPIVAQISAGPAINKWLRRRGRRC